MAVREPYITLANKAAQHPKTIAMTDREHRVWINAMLYANNYLTDGRIPRQWFVMNAGEDWEASLKHMTELGVLAELPNGSLEVCNYLEYQRSRAQIEADISRKRAMGKASGEARRKKSARTVRSTRGSAPVQHDVGIVKEQSCYATRNQQHFGAVQPQIERAVQPYVEPVVQRGVEPSVEQNTEYRSEISGDGCATAVSLSASDGDSPRAKGPAKARKRAAKAPEDPQAGVDHQRVVGAFSDEFLAAKGVRPHFEPKDVKAAKELRELMGPVDAIALIRHAFTSDFFVENTCSLNFVRHNINKLMPRGGLAPAPEASSSRIVLTEPSAPSGVTLTPEEFVRLFDEQEAS